MIGVIVWSSEAREKAIIWCEDNAALAYLQGRDDLTSSGFWPGPGDLVELESELVNNLRFARHVSILSERSCMQLPAMLKSSVVAASPDPHLRLVAVGKTSPSQAEEQEITAPKLKFSAVM